MVKIQCDYFSLYQICQSGQCFRMEQIGEDRFSVIAFGKYLEIVQNDNQIIFECTKQEYDEVWKEYFDIESDYEIIMSSIDTNDEYLQKAVNYGKGIRILKQDLWEMVISFIVSQQNNIKRIRKCINLLCEKYGEKRQTENGIVYYEFPTPQALANTTIEELYSCNLGYRSRYIYETANSILNNFIELENLFKMDYHMAKNELLKLCGVGVKVADCICLFALHKTEAFPVDTHINKVLSSQYPGGFPFDRYREYSGIIQQYIFYYDLNSKI